MARESERMRLMKENFMELHNQGLTVPQIAEKYNLGESTVYHKLQEIADANNVSRESLLKVVRTPSEKAYREEARRVRVNVNELLKGLDEADKGIQSTMSLINMILEEEEHYDK